MDVVGLLLKVEIINIHFLAPLWYSSKKKKGGKPRKTASFVFLALSSLLALIGRSSAFLCRLRFCIAFVRFGTIWRKPQSQ